jgi:hypothetical protein
VCVSQSVIDPEVLHTTSLPSKRLYLTWSATNPVYIVPSIAPPHSSPAI